jgi:hypothetical protein
MTHYRFKLILTVIAMAFAAAMPAAAQQKPPVFNSTKLLLYHSARFKAQQWVAANDAKSAKALLLLLEKAARTSAAMLKRVTLIQSGDPRGIAPPKSQAEADRNHRNLINHLERVELYWQWQIIVHDLQQALGQMDSPEAAEVFRKRIPLLKPEVKVILLMGMRAHTPNEVFSADVLKLLGKTRDVHVRVACIEVLTHHHERGALTDILKFLDTKRRIAEQIVACRYLAMMNDPKTSVTPLIKYLDKADRVRCKYQANAALRMLTGEKYHPHNTDQWRSWWAENKADFKNKIVLAPEDIYKAFNYELHVDKNEEAKEAEAIANTRNQDLYYYDIPFTTDRVVFILDISGSMTGPAVLGGTTSRLVEARDHLKKLITSLPPETEYGVLLFNHTAARWPIRSWTAPATKKNKASSLRFLDLAQPTGSTATLAAIEAVIRHMTAKAEIDTIFVLTDGVPNPMFIADYYKNSNSPVVPGTLREMINRIHFINQTQFVRVNTIGTGEAPSDFLKLVSKFNNGVFKASGLNKKKVKAP